mmetsp:Transcript_18642/g.60818  ORF Transcript_18642/g.60818 Transcript_18642/m.60818 type:complete len:301 (-) Transcript_18642:405-1307(-)
MREKVAASTQRAVERSNPKKYAMPSTSFSQRRANSTLLAGWRESSSCLRIMSSMSSPVRRASSESSAGAPLARQRRRKTHSSREGAGSDASSGGAWAGSSGTFAQRADSQTEMSRCVLTRTNPPSLSPSLCASNTLSRAAGEKALSTVGSLSTSHSARRIDRAQLAPTSRKASTSQSWRSSNDRASTWSIELVSAAQKAAHSTGSAMRSALRPTTKALVQRVATLRIELSRSELSAGPPSIATSSSTSNARLWPKLAQSVQPGRCSSSMSARTASRVASSETTPSSSPSSAPVASSLVWK